MPRVSRRSKGDLLQDFLDERAREGMGQSTVAHLRWNLRMIFALAVNEGLLDRNPAELLFVPKSESGERPILTLLRERLILKLCGLAGLRPGEAFALRPPENTHLNGQDCRRRNLEAAARDWPSINGTGVHILAEPRPTESPLPVSFANHFVLDVQLVRLAFHHRQPKIRQ